MTVHILRGINQHNPGLVGYGMALADVYRQTGNGEIVVDTMKETGMTLEDLEKSGLEEYDLDELKQAHNPDCS